MDLTTFTQRRRPEWRQLEQLLQRVEGSGLKTLDEEQAVDFGRLYRRAASDLNQAQTFVSADAIVRYLNELVARSYLVIYARTKVDPVGFLRYLFWSYPAIFRRHAWHFLLASAIFLGGSVLGFLAAYLEPASRAFLLPNDMPMIQPPQEGEQADGPLLSSGDLAAFSSHLFTNNVSVCLASFALGITLGAGTAWLLFVNGVILGALGAVFAEAHQLTAYATGVLPHGVLEIPAILIAGAAGFILAQGMIWARPWPRMAELAHSGKAALLMVAGCLPLIGVAALLEAGVARAPDWFMGSGLKLAVAGVFALAFVAYVLLLGWGRRSIPGDM